jgi:hypothetical protein
MQSNNNMNAPRQGAHPGSDEWMAFLYNEVSRNREAQLRTHLATCPECRAQMAGWTMARNDLNRWRLPVMLPAFRGVAINTLRWAAAAAIVAIVAFVAGRVTSPTAGQVARIEASLAQLAATVRQHQNTLAEAGNPGAVPSTTDEALRLLGDYAAFQAQQRRQDQSAVQSALAKLESGLHQVRGELETVAINTQTGFEQTQQNLTTLVSYTPRPESDPRGQFEKTE